MTNILASPVSFHQRLALHRLSFFPYSVGNAVSSHLDRGQLKGINYSQTEGSDATKGELTSKGT